MLALGRCNRRERACGKAGTPIADRRLRDKGGKASQGLEVGSFEIGGYFDFLFRATQFDPGRKLEVRLIGLRGSGGEGCYYVRYCCKGSRIDIALVCQGAPQGEPRLRFTQRLRQGMELLEQRRDITRSAIGVLKL